MELWIQIAIGMTVAHFVKEFQYQVQSWLWSYKHRNEPKTDTLSRLIFGDKFEEEELLEK